MKFIYTFLFLSITVISNSQSLKEKLQAQASGKVLASDELPKGMKLYDEKTFSDTAGISGVYFTKEPVRFFYQNTMNATKAFMVNQITIEYDPSVHAARLHVVNKEEEKMVRKKSIGLDHTKVFEMGNGAGTELADIAKKTGFYGFQTFARMNFTCLSYDYAGFNDVMVIENINDPGVWLVGHAVEIDAKKDIWEIRTYEKRNTKGGYFNVMSKDPKKLEGYDSLKIAKDLIASSKAFHSAEGVSFASKAVMPAQAVDDNGREAAYLTIIQEAASVDKPEAWGDKIQYAYISKDWTVEKSGGVISHRWCYAVATSTGWEDGNGRYIPCVIKEKYDGSGYGEPFFGGFKGGLIPIDEEKINSFDY